MPRWAGLASGSVLHSSAISRERRELAACGTPGAAGAELRIVTHREERHATAEVSFA